MIKKVRNAQKLLKLLKRTDALNFTSLTVRKQLIVIMRTIRREKPSTNCVCVLVGGGGGGGGYL